MKKKTAMIFLPPMAILFIGICAYFSKLRPALANVALPKIGVALQKTTAHPCDTIIHQKEFSTEEIQDIYKWLLQFDTSKTNHSDREFGYDYYNLNLYIDGYSSPCGHRHISKPFVELILSTTPDSVLQHICTYFSLNLVEYNGTYEMQYYLFAKPEKALSVYYSIASDSSFAKCLFPEIHSNKTISLRNSDATNLEKLVEFFSTIDHQYVEFMNENVNEVRFLIDCHIDNSLTRIISLLERNARVSNKPIGIDTIIKNNNYLNRPERADFVCIDNTSLVDTFIPFRYSILEEESKNFLIRRYCDYHFHRVFKTGHIPSSQISNNEYCTTIREKNLMQILAKSGSKYFDTMLTWFALTETAKDKYEWQPITLDPFIEIGGRGWDENSEFWKPGVNIYLCSREKMISKKLFVGIHEDSVASGKKPSYFFVPKILKDTLIISPSGQNHYATRTQEYAFANTNSSSLKIEYTFIYALDERFSRNYESEILHTHAEEKLLQKNIYPGLDSSIVINQAIFKILDSQGNILATGDDSLNLQYGDGTLFGCNAYLEPPIIIDANGDGHYDVYIKSSLGGLLVQDFGNNEFATIKF